MVVALPKSHSLMVPWLLSNKFSTCRIQKTVLMNLGCRDPGPESAVETERGSPEHSEGPSAHGNTQHLNFLLIQVSTCTFKNR